MRKCHITKCGSKKDLVKAGKTGKGDQKFICRPCIKRRTKKYGRYD